MEAENTNTLCVEWDSERPFYDSFFEDTIRHDSVCSLSPIRIKNVNWNRNKWQKL